ncbi:hypothetical protein [Aquimarina agarivorans]|uniref:hypothetical protein n=1 Tax=Aquimarina agarivorans TaxID=980584 RepID=UPI0011101FB3|nr:hypothetical protein [Aquimarina agarivorans]
MKIAFILAACVSFIACEEETETEVDCTLETTLTFDVSAETQGREVTLIAPFFEEATYQWFINDEEIEAGNNKSQFLHVFEGEAIKFDVCVLVTKNGCEETNRACEVYEIEKTEDESEGEDMLMCDLVQAIVMDQETKQEGREVRFVGPTYDLVGIKVDYKWYVNKELVKSGVDLNEYTHVFEKDELVDNTVCLTISTVGCEEEFTACLEYSVPSNGGCEFPLDFTIEKIGDQKVKLTVIEGPKDSGYVWTVSGNTFETTEGEFIYDDAQDGDEFCLFVETPDCPKGKQVCDTYKKK